MTLTGEWYRCDIFNSKLSRVCASKRRLYSRTSDLIYCKYIRAACSTNWIWMGKDKQRNEYRLNVYIVVAIAVYSFSKI
jgi:hypothetical protein